MAVCDGRFVAPTGQQRLGIALSVVLDQGGKVIRTHLGKISEQELDAVVGPLLAKPV
jgi:hypothetical protein